MAENTNKEKVVISFETNANDATKDVNKLSASIEQTTENVNENTNAVDRQDEAYKSLKTQLREANQELQKSIQIYGETSEQAIKAAQGVAELKDQMGFASDLVDTFNPDQKFKALGAATQLAATGVQGVTSGMALFGEQSEDTEKALLQVQSAMAFSDSISQLSNLGDQFQILKASIQQSAIAQRIFNLAAKANPYALVATAIAAAATAIYGWIKVSGDAAEQEKKLQLASEKLTAAIDYQSKSFENNSTHLSKSNENKIALLRASGASEKQIYAETRALKEQELQLAKNFRAEAIRAEQRAYILNRENRTDATAKILKDAQDNLVKAEKAVSDGFENLIVLQNNYEIARVQAETDARLKAEEKRKSDQEKADEKEKARREKLQADAKEKRKKELQEINELEDENETFRLKQREKLNEQKKEADEKDKQDFLTRSKETYESEKVIREKNEADEKAELEQKKANKDLLVSQAEALIQNVSKLAGKNKAIQKAAIVAEGGISVGKAVANTAEAVTKDLAKGAPFSAPLVALDLAVGATSVASIIQGTSKALQAVGAGGSVSAPALPNASGVNSQPQTGFQASSENQIATSINQSQQALPPIKAYVVGSEVTSQQSLDANLVKENSFGGI